MNKASIPNMLTSSRFLFAALIMLFLELSFPYAKLLALIMFAIAGITDWLDGYLARKVYGESNFGRLMDPLADKVMVCAALVSFVGISLPSLDTVLVPAYLGGHYFSAGIFSHGLASTRGRAGEGALSRQLGETQDGLANHCHHPHPARFNPALRFSSGSRCRISCSI